jgi:glycosyltransferase involved in cell wall biosynthesis
MNVNSSNGGVIAIIPCLNEERFIGSVVSKAVKHVDKVIVVDDGSTDATAKVAREAGAEVISHKVRQGAGAATRTGFEAALKYGAGVVVTLDGDGQHNPDEIQSVVQPVLSGNADLVIGSRFLCAAKVAFHRKFGIDFITWLYNVGHKDKIVDGQSGFRAYGRKALEVIKITYPGFGFSIQTLVQPRNYKLKIMEVPISCIYHEEGSTQDPISHGLSVAWAVVKIRMKEELFTSRTRPG